MHVSNLLWPAQLGFANVLVIGRCVIAVDLLNNDDLFVTSNWWGQSWGRTCEPVSLTKLGTCLTHPTSLPYTRTRIVAGQRLVRYTTPLPGNPPRLLYREAR